MDTPRPSQPVSLRDLLDQCDLPNLPYLMEYHAILRDLPDQLARTGIQLRRDQHGLQQLMTPRVEYDPPPKIGCKRTQNLPDIVPPLSDTDSFESSEEDTIAALSGSCSSLRRRGSSSNVPPSAGSVPAPIPVDPPIPSLDRLLFRVYPHHMQSNES